MDYSDFTSTENEQMGYETLVLLQHRERDKMHDCSNCIFFNKESTHVSILEPQTFQRLQNNLILKKRKMTQTNNISMNRGTTLDRMDQIHQHRNVGSNIAVRTQEHQLSNKIIHFE